jgi:hypothetical protein
VKFSESENPNILEMKIETRRKKRDEEEKWRDGGEEELTCDDGSELEMEED